MPILRTCWSPFIWNNDVKTGSYAVAFYTMATSLIIITWTAFEMSGGDSSHFYMPLFETDVRDTMQLFGGLEIVLFLLMIAFSGLMIKGIKISNRGFILPWLWGMAFLIFLQILFGIWLLYGYYIYLQSVMACLVLWIWMGYNIYCWLCVYSFYDILREMQAPNIVLLY
ncbi:uncharacterized protein LOC132198851 [Neocloeon triangulifer]|uniref:uncharacterized protein LOC132198851 n=1 Tax=Neocloeon triangulifer TaxID=2078957 RepID=UPI00286F1D2D|nr:uncharacterized protein LOC132198851 [Neocloeon triangulifer]